MAGFFFVSDAKLAVKKTSIFANIHIKKKTTKNSSANHSQMVIIVAKLHSNYFLGNISVI